MELPNKVDHAAWWEQRHREQRQEREVMAARIEGYVKGRRAARRFLVPALCAAFALGGIAGLWIGHFAYSRAPAEACP